MDGYIQFSSDSTEKVDYASGDTGLLYAKELNTMYNLVSKPIEDMGDNTYVDFKHASAVSELLHSNQYSDGYITNNVLTLNKKIDNIDDGSIIIVKLNNKDYSQNIDKVKVNDIIYDLTNELSRIKVDGYICLVKYGTKYKQVFFNGEVLDRDDINTKARVNDSEETTFRSIINDTIHSRSIPKKFYGDGTYRYIYINPNTSITNFVINFSLTLSFNVNERRTLDFVYSSTRGRRSVTCINSMDSIEMQVFAELLRSDSDVDNFKNGLKLYLERPNDIEHESFGTNYGAISRFDKPVITIVDEIKYEDDDVKPTYVIFTDNEDANIDTGVLFPLQREANVSDAAKERLKQRIIKRETIEDAVDTNITPHRGVSLENEMTFKANSSVTDGEFDIIRFNRDTGLVTRTNYNGTFNQPTTLLDIKALLSNAYENILGNLTLGETNIWFLEYKATTLNNRANNLPHDLLRNYFYEGNRDNETFGSVNTNGDGVEIYSNSTLDDPESVVTQYLADGPLDLQPKVLPSRKYYDGRFEYDNPDNYWECLGVGHLTSTVSNPISDAIYEPYQEDGYYNEFIFNRDGLRLHAPYLHNDRLYKNPADQNAKVGAINMTGCGIRNETTFLGQILVKSFDGLNMQDGNSKIDIKARLVTFDHTNNTRTEVVHELTGGDTLQESARNRPDGYTGLFTDFNENITFSYGHTPDLYEATLTPGTDTDYSEYLLNPYEDKFERFISNGDYEGDGILIDGVRYTSDFKPIIKSNSDTTSHINYQANSGISMGRPPYNYDYMHKDYYLDDEKEQSQLVPVFQPYYMTAGKGWVYPIAETTDACMFINLEDGETYGYGDGRYGRLNSYDPNNNPNNYDMFEKHQPLYSMASTSQNLYHDDLDYTSLKRVLVSDKITNPLKLNNIRINKTHTLLEISPNEILGTGLFYGVAIGYNRLSYANKNNPTEAGEKVDMEDIFTASLKGSESHCHIRYQEISFMATTTTGLIRTYHNANYDQKTFPTILISGETNNTINDMSSDWMKSRYIDEISIGKNPYHYEIDINGETRHIYDDVATSIHLSFDTCLALSMAFSNNHDDTNPDYDLIHRTNEFRKQSKEDGNDNVWDNRWVPGLGRYSVYGYGNATKLTTYGFKRIALTDEKFDTSYALHSYEYAVKYLRTEPDPKRYVDDILLVDSNSWLFDNTYHSDNNTDYRHEYQTLSIQNDRVININKYNSPYSDYNTVELTESYDYTKSKKELAHYLRDYDEMYKGINNDFRVGYLTYAKQNPFKELIRAEHNYSAII